MSRLYVMRSGRTAFSEQNRIDSGAGAPLTVESAAAVREQAGELAGAGIEAVYSSSNESDQQTAQIAAQVLGVRHAFQDDLRDLDFGLWQGLLVEEVGRRYPKAHRQWQEQPAGVCPPDGEMMEQTQQRLCRALRKILKRHRGQNVLVVLHPIAAALVRCRLLGIELSELWQQLDQPGETAWYDMDRACGAQERL